MIVGVVGGVTVVQTGDLLQLCIPRLWGAWALSDRKEVNDGSQNKDAING